MGRIHEVYSQSPLLKHVEFGKVIQENESWTNKCLITRIGNKITAHNLTVFGLTKNAVIEQVKQGLVELHGIGLAHCDISVNNVYIQ